MSHFDQHQVATARHDLVLTVQFLAAATFIGEPDVFTDYLTWLRELYDHRGIPPRALAAGLDALHPLVFDVDPGVAMMLDTGRAVLSAVPSPGNHSS